MATIVPVPFRYDPTTGIIIAHFSSRGKGLDLREAQPWRCGKANAAPKAQMTLDVFAA
jgi:hypothetical protein